MPCQTLRVLYTLSVTENVFEEQRQLAAAVNQTDDRVWDAETAEQAAAFLRMTFFWPSAGGRRDKQKITLPKRVLFRGQSHATWAPVPTLLRRSGDEALRAERMTRLAAGVIQSEMRILWSAEWAQGWPPFGSRSGLAAAQHYGFDTMLLDWTTNPSIAVEFATCSRSSAESPRAAVLWLGVIDAAELGLDIILPPAIVLRLYRQRGVFTELDAARLAAVQSRVGMVRFPAQPRCPVLGTTDGRDRIPVDLLPKEPWFEQLKTWAAAHVDDESLLAEPMLANIAFTTRHGHHPAMAQLVSMLPLYPQGQVDMMRLLIDQLAARELNDQRYYEPWTLDLLARSNPGLLEWLEAEQPLPRLPVTGKPF